MPSAKPESWLTRLTASIASSRVAGVRGSNFVQLATCDATGAPHNRTVVFRGFLEAPTLRGTAALRFITDARSAKVQHGRRAELCWWFGHSSEQFRVAGELQFVGEGGAVESGGDSAVEESAERQAELSTARQAAWVKLSDPAREQFFWRAPGLVLDADGAGAGGAGAGAGNSAAADGAAAGGAAAGEGAGAGGVPPGGRVAEGARKGELLPPPPTFLLMLLWPTRCDSLCLTDNRRRLDALDEGSGQWAASLDVTP